MHNGPRTPPHRRSRIVDGPLSWPARALAALSSHPPHSLASPCRLHLSASLCASAFAPPLPPIHPRRFTVRTPSWRSSSGPFRAILPSERASVSSSTRACATLDVQFRPPLPCIVQYESHVYISRLHSQPTPADAHVLLAIAQVQARTYACTSAMHPGGPFFHFSQRLHVLPPSPHLISEPFFLSSLPSVHLTSISLSSFHPSWVKRVCCISFQYRAPWHLAPFINLNLML